MVKIKGITLVCDCGAGLEVPPNTEDIENVCLECGQRHRIMVSNKNKESCSVFALERDKIGDYALDNRKLGKSYKKVV